MSFQIKELPVVFIGAGKLATNLAKAMFENEFQILEVYSRTKESAKELADNVNAKWVTDLQNLTTKNALYIVSLKDAALVDLLPQIIKGRETSLLVHTAGSIPMSIWGNTLRHYGVFYPLQTFSKKHEVNFKEIPFFIEASSPEDEDKLKVIALALSEKVFIADSEQRKSLHLSAVFACNFVNHMYALAADLLQKYQLPFEALLPLIDETARKVHTLSPDQAQTGPAVRYDESVIKKHLDMLADEPSMQDIYRMLSQSIHIYQSYITTKKQD
ncbi:MAG: DUF2520 domain-containing protein [Bacteroides sp.]|nr:DUF2520 domain-containing protein [Bacteroides sp.]